MRNTLYFTAALAFFSLSASAQPITSCGTTLSAPGNYYLAGNLTCPTTNSGIIVAADNVTIDLKGFTLSGSGLKAGVTNMNAAGSCAIVPKYLTVTNGRISNWLVAVSLCAPSGPAQLSRAQIKNLTIFGNGTGVSLTNLIGAVVSRNTIESNNLPVGAVRVGVSLSLGSLNSVSSNTIRFNTNAGVLVGSGSEQNVYNNTVLNNGPYGIRVNAGASMSTVKQNQAFGHTTWDLADESTGCGTNVWTLNTYGTRNQTCIN